MRMLRNQMGWLSACSAMWPNESCSGDPAASSSFASASVGIELRTLVAHHFDAVHAVNHLFVAVHFDLDGHPLIERKAASTWNR